MSDLQTQSIDLPSALESGRYLKLTEIDSKPRCDDDSLPHNGAFMTWWNALKQATNKLDLPITLDVKTMKNELVGAGSEDIQVEVVNLPTGNDSSKCKEHFDQSLPDDCPKCTFSPHNELKRAVGDVYADAIADDDCSRLNSISNAAFFASPPSVREIGETWQSLKWKVLQEMQDTRCMSTIGCESKLALYPSLGDLIH